ncbi:MAG: FkbM family methyltransferase [Candidatus Paceibacterota bacterium]
MISHLIPSRLLERIMFLKFKYATVSFSQHGEDTILRDLLWKTKKGFYVDIGAHHPTRFSNTYWFYRNGWKGINIDASPGSMKNFRTIRPNDINIEIGISEKPNVMNFFRFNKPAFNTFSIQLANKYKEQGFKLLDTVKVNTDTLENILDKNFPLGQTIDFMSIDAEGYDLEVLKSNDWSRFIPKIIVIEDNNFSVENPYNSPIANFLKEKSYKIITYTGHTLFLLNNNNYIS